MSQATPALRGKQLQLIKEVVPRLNSVAILWNPNGPSLELIIAYGVDLGDSARRAAGSISTPHLIGHTHTGPCHRRYGQETSP